MVSEDRKKQVAAIAKEAKDGRHRLPRHRPRPRGRGDRLARRRGGATCQPDKTRRVTFSEITAGRHPRRLREPARDRPQPRRRAADAAHPRSPGRLHAQPAAVAQGPRRAVGRPRPVGRRAPGRRARARDPRLHGARVLDDRGRPRDRHRRDVHSRAVRRSMARRSRRARTRAFTSATRRPRAARRRAARRSPAGRRAITTPPEQAPPGAAVHDHDAPAGSQPQARLQPQADDAHRPAPVRGRRHSTTGRVGLITYMRTDSTEHGRRCPDARRATSSRRATGCATSCPRAASYTTKSKGAQEAHEAIRPTSFARDPDRLATALTAERAERSTG